jgi:hypothetical protein
MKQDKPGIIRSFNYWFDKFDVPGDSDAGGHAVSDHSGCHCADRNTGYSVTQDMPVGVTIWQSLMHTLDAGVLSGTIRRISGL